MTNLSIKHWYNFERFEQVTKFLKNVLEGTATYSMNAHACQAYNFLSLTSFDAVTFRMPDLHFFIYSSLTPRCIDIKSFYFILFFFCLVLTKAGDETECLLQFSDVKEMWKAFTSVEGLSGQGDYGTAVVS